MKLNLDSEKELKPVLQFLEGIISLWIVTNLILWAFSKLGI